MLAALLLAVAVAAWPRDDGTWRADKGPVVAGDLSVPAWVGGPRVSGRRPGGSGGDPALGDRAPWARPFWVAAGHLSRRVRGRRESRDADELLVLLDAIAPALAAGLPPAAALAHLTRHDPGVAAGEPRAPVQALLADLVAESSAGRPLAPVWTRHARGRWSAEVAFVARAWSLSESLGSPLAECATVAARAVRQQSARRQRLSIALAGPRATAGVLTALPLAGPVVGLLLGLSPKQLYATPAAVVSTLLGLGLLLLGRWWCARLVASIGRGRPAGKARASPTPRPSAWVKR